MSDSILVRVTLGSYDFAHPAEKQTHVYVQIPEVARASWMLPASMFHGLSGRAWPEVLGVAHDHYTHSGVVSDSTSTAARDAVRKWLLEDPNRAEMQAAWEEDQARRDPVAGKLLRQNERLTARVAELEKANAGLDDLRQQALARVAELEAAQGTVYRASHDAIVMGHYTSREAAQAHCEAKVRHEEPEGSIRHMSWVADDIGDEAEYELHITPAETGGLIRGTGYLVTPLEVASEYDEEADE
jgi:hypothetical protein